MAEQACKRQCAQTFMRCIHCERHVAHVQCVTRFVVTGLVQRCLQANHDAILAQYEFVSTHPTTIRAKDSMVRGTGQRAPILQDKRYAFSFTLHYLLALYRRTQSAILSWSQ